MYTVYTSIYVIHLAYSDACNVYYIYYTRWFSYLIPCFNSEEKSSCWTTALDVHSSLQCCHVEADVVTFNSSITVAKSWWLAIDTLQHMANHATSPVTRQHMKEKHVIDWGRNSKMGGEDCPICRALAITWCLFIFNWIESHQQEVVMILHIQILIKPKIASDHRILCRWLCLIET